MASFSEEINLCRNMDCERFPPDWDEEEDTEDTYREGQWKKCCLCDGYFDDDGLGDILFIEEEPNNTRASCNLCGKDKNIVQMKGTGQYICEAACDESSEEDSSAEEESSDEESNVIYTKYVCKYCGFTQVKDDPDCPECGKTFCMLASQESDKSVYTLEPESKKSIYQTEEWVKFFGEKQVQFNIKTIFYWGSAEIELTKSEKKEILQKKELVLNDHGCSMNKLEDGCYEEGEIYKKEKYTDDEIREIEKVLYRDEEMQIDQDYLEENGWELIDTIYGLTCPCKLTKISD